MGRALGSSPIHERDAFVFFDESRCRGADMKLKPKAVAALTIGPGMCKDKLMQAAGRMRLLQCEQHLIIFVPHELELKIRKNDRESITTTSSLTSSSTAGLFTRTRARTAN
jgi:hypothetical protein